MNSRLRAPPSVFKSFWFESFVAQKKVLSNSRSDNCILSAKCLFGSSTKTLVADTNHCDQFVIHLFLQHIFLARRNFFVTRPLYLFRHSWKYIPCHCTEKIQKTSNFIEQDVQPKLDIAFWLVTTTKRNWKCSKTVCEDEYITKWFSEFTEIRNYRVVETMKHLQFWMALFLFQLYKKAHVRPGTLKPVLIAKPTVASGLCMYKPQMVAILPLNDPKISKSV